MSKPDAPEKPSSLRSAYERIKLTPTRLFIWGVATIGSQAVWSSLHGKPQPSPAMEMVRDHVGNVPLSMSSIIGGVFGAIVAERIARGESATKARLVTGALLGALTVGAVLNGLVETKFGHNVMGSLPRVLENVPLFGDFVKNPGHSDAADAGVGIATAAATATLVYTKARQPSIKQETIDSAPDDIELIALKSPARMVDIAPKPGEAFGKDVHWDELLDLPEGYNPMHSIPADIAARQPAELVSAG